MLKYKFNYRNQTLAYQPLGSELWCQIEDQFTGNFGSLGFQLTDGWMTFAVYEKRIRVFYKQIQPPYDPEDYWEPQKITYFRKDLAKQEKVIFTWEAQDRVEKIGQAWVKKGEPKM